MSSRQGYEQSVEFDEYGEFGKYGKFDYVLPKTKYNRMSNKVANLANMANFTIFCKRPKMHESERAQDNSTNKAANSTNAATFFFNFSAPIGNETDSVDCGHHKTPFDIFLFRFPG